MLKKTVDDPNHRGIHTCDGRCAKTVESFSDEDLKEFKAEIAEAERLGMEHLAGLHVLKPLIARLEDSERDCDYWKNRCVSAEEKSKGDHFALVASGYFSKRKAAGKESK